MRKDYFSSKEVRSADVIALGLAKAIAEAKSLGKKRVWIVSHGKSNLDGYISDAIGKGAADALSKGKSVRAGDIEIVFYGDRTLPYGGDGSPVVVCYPNDKLLDKLDGMSGIPCLIVLPWLHQETEAWIAAHAPEDIYGAVTTAQSTVSNPVVEKALETLLAVINVSTGISHPSDKATAMRIFKTLIKGKEAYDPDEVRAWLVQKGMRPNHANDIRDIAADPSKFRARTDSSPNMDQLRRWREEAGK